MKKVVCVLVLFALLLLLSYWGYCEYTLRGLEQNAPVIKRGMTENLPDLTNWRKLTNKKYGSNDRLPVYLSSDTFFGQAVVVYSDGRVVRVSSTEYNDLILSADALDVVVSLSMALAIYKVENAWYPDSDDGYFKLTRDETNKGLMDIFIDAYELRIADNVKFDDKGRLLDPWGNPYRYVKGNGAARKPYDQRSDDDLPYDTNKPIHRDIPASASDWNNLNQICYAYVYSYGAGDETTPETWIYIRD